MALQSNPLMNKSASAVSLYSSTTSSLLKFKQGRSVLKISNSKKEVRLWGRQGPTCVRAVSRNSSSSSSDAKKGGGGGVPNSNYVVPLDKSFSSANSSCITRPLAEILRDLNKRIPDNIIKTPSPSTTPVIPW